MGPRGKMRMPNEGVFASKSASIYDPKPLPPRPFEHDYPNAGTSAGDAGRRLEIDLDGRPLSAGLVVGRRVAGGVDQAATPRDVAGLSDAFRIPVSLVNRSGKELGGNVGKYRVTPGAESTKREIFLDKSLLADESERVLAHEFAHSIDDPNVYKSATAGIPTTGLSKELRRIYEDLNTGTWFKSGKGRSPEGMGYKGDDVDRELMAEAIRAYMRDPNWQ